MIDTHCHLYPPQFEAAAIPPLLGAARAAGVRAIVVVPESLDDARTVLQLAAEQPMLHAAAGLHPVQPVHGPPGSGETYLGCRSVSDVAEAEGMLAFIREHADELVAIGEVGLDFSPHVLGMPSSSSSRRAASAAAGGATAAAGSTAEQQARAEQLKQAQLAVFAAQIQLANELGLPLNVHSRSAGHHAIEALISHGARAAVLHAFDGKLSHARRGAEAGFLFSVPPSVVRSSQKQKLVVGLPLESLLLETDAPALGPEQGTPNVPANIVAAAAEIARIKGCDVGAVVEATTANALRLFPRLAARLGG